MEGASTAPAPTGSKRTTRGASPAWLAGPLSAGLGLAAHLAAGGQAPGIPIVTALAALLGMAASIAASISGGRRLPGWAVLLAAGLVQQLLHLAFDAFSTASGFPFPATMEELRPRRRRIRQHLPRKDPALPTPRT